MPALCQGAGLCAPPPGTHVALPDRGGVSPRVSRHLAQKGVTLPDFVEQEFDAYLACGRLEHGFLRVRCEQCHAEQLVAFSCKKRGFCPSCGARRMAETAALLVDEILPRQPLRQWVLSVPYPLRFPCLPAAPTSWAACWPSCTAPLPRT
jgi:ribosomal protein S27E